MDTLSPVNRVLDRLTETLISETPPWEQAIEDMGAAVRDHLEEEIQTAIRACRDHLAIEINRQLTEASNRAVAQIDPAVKMAVDLAMKPIREEISVLQKMVETLPDLVRAVVEGVPDVIVQTPRRKVEKRIEYDAENKPSRVVEVEVMEKV